MPPTTIQEKSINASRKINCPVPTASSANLNIINEDASLSRLSPSSTAEVDFGIFTNFKIAPVLTASGGETNTNQ